MQLAAGKIHAARLEKRDVKVFYDCNQVYYKRFVHQINLTTIGLILQIAD